MGWEREREGEERDDVSSFADFFFFAFWFGVERCDWKVWRETERY